MVLLALPLAGCAAETPKTVQVRMHSVMPVGHYTDEAVKVFIEEATTESAGTLEFAQYPAQQLYEDLEIVDVLPEGTLEMAQTDPARFAGRCPTGNIMSTSGYFKDIDHYYRFLYDTAGGGGYFYSHMQPDWEKNGNTKLLATSLYAPNYAIITVDPVTEVSDHQGLKVRASGSTVAVVLEALGASPVVMSSSDVYMAMERRTIDGGASGLTTFVSRKWYEVAKNVSIFQWGPVPYVIAANLDWWNSLSSEQQTAIEKAARTAEAYPIEAGLASIDADIQQLKDLGCTVYEFDDAQSAEIRGLIKQKMDVFMQESMGADVAAEAIAMVEATENGTATWKDIVASRPIG